MGFDHPQWEMYSGSKHGVRYLLKQTGVLPETRRAPTCQTCHMQERRPRVVTAWGFLAVRLPDARGQAVGRRPGDHPPGPRACSTPRASRPARLDVVKAADVARLTQEDWQKERDKMVDDLHASATRRNFARASSRRATR